MGEGLLDLPCLLDEEGFEKEEEGGEGGAMGENELAQAGAVGAVEEAIRGMLEGLERTLRCSDSIATGEGEGEGEEKEGEGLHWRVRHKMSERERGRQKQEDKAKQGRGEKQREGGVESGREDYGYGSAKPWLQLSSLGEAREGGERVFEREVSRLSAELSSVRVELGECERLFGEVERQRREMEERAEERRERDLDIARSEATRLAEAWRREVCRCEAEFRGELAEREEVRWRPPPPVKRGEAPLEYWLGLLELFLTPSHPHTLLRSLSLPPYPPYLPASRPPTLPPAHHMPPSPLSC